jgi:hypothetical protein
VRLNAGLLAVLMYLYSTGTLRKISDEAASPAGDCQAQS